jgi:hypothetical protein
VASSAWSCLRRPLLPRPSCCRLRCQTCRHHWCSAVAGQPWLAAEHLVRCCQAQTCCGQNRHLLYLAAAVARLRCRGQGLSAGGSNMQQQNCFSRQYNFYCLQSSRLKNNTYSHVTQQVAGELHVTQQVADSQAAQSTSSTLSMLALLEASRLQLHIQHWHSHAPPPGVGLSSITDLCCWIVVICRRQHVTCRWVNVAGLHTTHVQQLEVQARCKSAEQLHASLHSWWQVDNNHCQQPACDTVMSSCAHHLHGP